MEKTRVALCDDQTIVLDELQRMLSDIACELDFDCEWFSFTDPRALVERVKEMQIVFLDIEMPQMDGIDTGKAIRNVAPDCIIIMATGMPERVREAFHISAFRFLTKPFDREEVREAFQSAMTKCVGFGTVALNRDRVMYKINQRDIMYFYSGDSSVEAVMSSGERYRSEDSLDRLEEKLDKRIFVRIHKKYLVNCVFIDGFNQKEVFIGKQKLSIARRKLTETKKRIMEYDLYWR